MAMKKETHGKLSLDISSNQDQQMLVEISRALSNRDRIKILNLLNDGPLYIMEISQKLKLPLSTTSNHIQILDDAKLILTEYTPTLKGHMKLCSRAVTNFDVTIWKPDKNTSNEITIIEMPIGNFIDTNIYAPCGMAGKYSMLIEEDQPTSFYSPTRTNAQLLWFKKGYITYRFPLDKIDPSSIRELSIELELCSETAYYKENWPSDITFYLCGKELFTYTSPGDFGEKRGLLNPIWWPSGNTQYGLLKKFLITSTGVYFDGKIVNDKFNIKNLKPLFNEFIELKIEIKDDANHVGGINIFGKSFGNYSQDIVLKILHN